MKEEEKKKENKWKVMFWNVIELKNKDKEFWKGLENWEVLILAETWVEEKS